MNNKILEIASKLRQIGRLQVSRILGTVSNTNGAYKALIDLLERSYFMRVEANALAGILIKKGLLTQEEWLAQLEEEYEHYFKELSKQWPEVEFHPQSFVIKDFDTFKKRVAEEAWPK